MNENLISIFQSGEDQVIATIEIKDGKLRIDTSLPDAEAVVLLQTIVVAMENEMGEPDD